MNASDYIPVNQRHWNANVPVHLASEFYNLEDWKSGQTSLKPAELEALGDVRGKSILHLQCHFGQDSISWARKGASVTGVDFSSEAIAVARRLAAEEGADAQFIETDVYQTSEYLGETQFDCVVSTYGALPWLPDLDRWATLVARHLKSGGKLCMVEFHPTYYMYEFEPFELKYDYFNTGPIVEESEGTYADRLATLANKSISWNHSLSEVIRPLLREGLTLVDLTEFPYSYYDCFPNLMKNSEGYFELSEVSVKLPLMYRMVFVKGNGEVGKENFKI